MNQKLFRKKVKAYTLTEILAGVNVLNANTTGFANVGVGGLVLSANTSGINNVAVGGAALYSNTSGGQNIAMGYQALKANTTSYGSVGIGTNSLTLANGQGNIAVGYETGHGLIDGVGDTFLGFFTGANITGSNNTVIGGSISAETTGITSISVIYLKFRPQLSLLKKE